MPIVVKDYVDSASLLPRSIWYVFVIFLSQYVLGALGTYLVASSTDRYIATFRAKIVNHVIHLKMRFFDETNSAETTSRIINDVTMIRSFMTSNVPQLINGIVTIVVSGVAVTLIDYKLTILLFVIFPAAVLVAVPIGGFNEKNANAMQGVIGMLSSKTSETLRNMCAVKLDNAEQKMIFGLRASINQLYQLSNKADKAYAVIEPVQGAISLLFTALVFFYGMSRVRSGTLTTGEFTAYIMFFFQLIGPIGAVLNFYVGFRSMKGATARIKRVMREEPEQVQFSTPQSRIPIAREHRGPIMLDDVSFSYEDEQVLEHISMVFRESEHVAIVGATGAGKTTIINLLTRLYPITDGHLTLSGMDAEQFGLSDWRRLFGVVTQENAIFTGTIRDNLTLGLPDVLDESEIMKAIHVAGLEDVVRAAHGIDSNIGEHGLKLSGGQRQRIQIARAYLRKPAFLVLDEATSNLDSHTEAQIIERLSASIECPTMISIAHRLSTVISSDRIYCLSGKEVEAVGTHDELMQTSETYRILVKSQLFQAPEQE
ncbi:MAG: ABC transporter ATP-binding protein/permease [Bifidobacterium subtile]|jgi:ATP-binding cassette subfamily B protein AbcA/BmrA|nr:ABC transporter ATP-binding protein/permease [Bifidobacterium subtile]